ncbi:spherulation-specific family 4 protein [Lentzea sp.]|uniref:spherulation-specific family 4 protein n=1 Tax=Lentzea sp. TaxID=56099 RepID=UPI002ED47612
MLVRFKFRRRANPVRRRRTAVLLCLSLVATLLNAVPAQPASATPLSGTSLITYNMQGGTNSIESKWTLDVSGYAANADVVMLQEVGPNGPPSAHDEGTAVTPEGLVYRRYLWLSRHITYNVIFVETDATGGRVNIAIVTRHEPDEIRIVRNPVARGRAALGVRLGNDWYFTFHGLSGRQGTSDTSGGDSARMLNEIDAEVGRWSNSTARWHAGGDFNLDPEEMQRRQYFPVAHVYNSGRATHQNGGELDYFVTSDIQARLPNARRLNGASSDHYAVNLGGLLASAMPPQVRVRPYVPRTHASVFSSILKGLSTLAAGVVTAWALFGPKRDEPLAFVGSQTSGGIAYEDFAGTSSAGAQELSGRAAGAPSNVTLLQPDHSSLDLNNTDSAVASLRSRAERVLQADPSQTVLIAGVLPASTVDQQKVDQLNAGIGTLVQSLQGSGKHVVQADTRSLTRDDLEADGATLTSGGVAELSGAYVDAIVVAYLRDWLVDTDALPGGGGGVNQQIAVASYIHPLADPDAWNRLIASPTDKVSVLVANVTNGPDTTVNTSWQNVINRAGATGKRVLGYVPTGYLGVSEQHFKTRLGSTDLADWTAQIERDIDKWYELYGNSIGGIFFDEGWNDCGPDNKYAKLYRHLNQYVKRNHFGAMTVLNPGATMPQCFEDSADTLMTFESSYESYTRNYVPNTWTSADPRKLWHIVYNVPESEIGRIIELSKQRGVGYVQITNDVLDNPYDTLPQQSYWQKHMDLVKGGKPGTTFADPYNVGAPAPTAPSNLRVTASDYTSVTLEWSPGGNAVAHQVYLNNQPILNLPAGMNRVAVGNLQTGASNLAFQVTTQGGSGVESAVSNTVTASTPGLPGGHTVTNVRISTSAGSTTYTADILVPYAFKRLYVFSSDSGCDDWKRNPGWPVNYNSWNYVCANYMVEGTTLFKYSGTVPDGTTNVPWSWTSVGSAPVSINGHTHTWTVPIGTSAIDTKNLVIQAEGYGPTTNVFTPCPIWGAGPEGNGRYCA